MAYKKRAEIIDELQKELPELTCKVSYGGFHMWRVFQEGTTKYKYIGICERCLKTRIVDLTTE